MALDKKLLRTAEFPTIWCPGCGHGVVTQGVIRACNDMGWDKDDIFAVSGIGCSARTTAYMDFNSVQTTHGRALAFATGMKAAHPEKHVFLLLGDGDCMSIGGNHFMHSCKRNIDLTVVVLNNFIYGMTGGQVSPTTPHNAISTTTAYGNIDEPVDICKIAIAAGATFVARTTAYHAAQIPDLVKRGFKNHGFSVIEVLDPCPTGFGGRNGFKAVTQMYDKLRDNSITIEQASKLSEEELEGKYVIGVFKDSTREEYLDKYKRMVEGIKNSTAPKDLSANSNYKAEPLKAPRYECRLSGSGGQGLLMSGIIFCETMIRQGKNAVHAQSYGVEARGGKSRSDVIVSDGEINFPEVASADLLLAMTQDSYEEYRGGVKDGGMIVTDSTFVKAEKIPGRRCYEYPITNYAKDTLGEIRSANILALGIITGLNKFICKDAMMDTVLGRLPKKVHELNIKAFEEGYEVGRKMLESKEAE